MQSNRNTSETDTFHEPTNYEPHALTSSDKKITFARHRYGRVGVFKIKMRLLVLKLKPLKKCHTVLRIRSFQILLLTSMILPIKQV